MIKKALWLRKNDIANQIGKTPRQIDEMFKRGEIEDNGKTGIKRRFKFFSEDEEVEELSSYDLKEKHLEVKIKKEQQLLYDNRLLLAEKVVDLFLNVYHLPRVQGLTEIVRKYGAKELIEAWNQEIEIGAKRNEQQLLDELQSLTVS